MRWCRKDGKWEAYVTYRDQSGKRKWKNRQFATREEAETELPKLRAEYEPLASKYLGKVGEAYKCPSCQRERPYRDRRVIWNHDGVCTIICRGCYALGPEVVGQNLRRYMEDSLVQ